MGTTTAVINNTQTFDFTLRDTMRQEMNAVLSRCLPSFYRHAFRHLRNVADAEDAVQDALLSAHQHLSQFRGQARISTWLTAIVINSARMQLRKRSRQAQVSLDEHYPDQEGFALSELLPARSPSPEELCCRTELAEHMLHFVRQLSPTLSRVFQLRHLDGLTIREIADVLGVAEGTVKAQLARARAKLRLLMRKKLIGFAARKGSRSPAIVKKSTPDRSGSGCDE